MHLPDFLIDHPDGEIRLTGHRISLFDVVFFFKKAFSPERIHRQFPTLSVELIRKVIAFYQENQAEVDTHVAEVQAEIDRLRAEDRKGPTLLELRLRMEAKKREPIS
jgi:uncharacterized protein (DUF433 family)